MARVDPPSAPVSPDPAASDSQVAWQPLTTRGLAAFGKATFGRTLLLLFAISLIGAGTVVWFLNAAWFPAIRAAITRLPEGGQLAEGRLVSPATEALTLAEYRCLGFILLPSGAARSDLNSHIAVRFEAADVQICSMLGCRKFAYPLQLRMPIGRPDLQARWEAWQPTVNVAAALGTIIVLLALWLVCGFLSSFLLWPVAWARKKDLGWMGAWRVGSISLSTGSLFLLLALWAYGFGLLDLLQLLIAGVLQFAVWITYLVLVFRVIPTRMPPPPAPENPFASPVDPAAASSSPFRS